MKKIFAVSLLLVIIVSMTACGSDNNNDLSQQNQSDSLSADISASSAGSSELQEEEASEPVTGNNDTQNEASSDVPAEENGSEHGSNILVAYFSRVGNTVWEDDVDAVTSASLNAENSEFVGNAEYLAKMAQEATGGDLFLIQTVETYPSDYRATTDVAAVEQENDARPELASHVENMDQYDTIVLIYPNWWGTLPQPVFTFLEEYDFSGKTILPLCTHEGSRMGSSERAITELCPDAILLGGLAVRGSNASSAKSDVETWINDSGILE